jgi:hypothetical protein
MSKKWYQIAVSKLGSDEVRTGQVEVESISNVVLALGKYGWHVHRSYEIDPPKEPTGNPLLNIPVGSV